MYGVHCIRHVGGKNAAKTLGRVAAKAETQTGGNLGTEQREREGEQRDGPDRVATK